MLLKLLCLTFLFLPGGLLEFTTDYANSIAGMKSLVEMETSLIEEFANYTKALKDKINIIESFVVEAKAKREISKGNPEEFVAHPLNAFSLIRRLHEDWTYLELFMSKQVGENHLQAIQETLKKGQPTERDMQNAVNGMITIQRTNDQEASDMAKGFLVKQQYSANMTTLECLDIAHNCERLGDSQYVISWYKAALQQYDELRDGQVYREVFGFKINDLYKNLSTALEKSGFLKASIDILRDVSDLDAELWLQQRELNEVFKTNWEDPIVIPIDLPPNKCKGNWPAAVSNLSCYYERERSAFLTIAPLKTEILNENPSIVLYHNVIYDSEILRIKNTSLYKLKSPSKSYPNGDGLNFKSTIYRDKQSRLNNRIRDLTGLEMKDEGFEVYNYGIGGYHNDNLTIQAQKPGLGEVHTNIVFFLNNVPEGGAISFSELNLTVFPQKGNALLWHNLDNALQPFYCPVVLGSKWTLVTRRSPSVCQTFYEKNVSTVSRGTPA